MSGSLTSLADALRRDIADGVTFLTVEALMMHCWEQMRLNPAHTHEAYELYRRVADAYEQEGRPVRDGCFDTAALAAVVERLIGDAP